MGLGAAAPCLGGGVPGLGDLVSGDGGEQRGVELRPGPAEGDQGVVADPGDGPGLESVGEQVCGLVVDGGCGAQRGCGDERAIAGEVVAQ